MIRLSFLLLLVACNGAPANTCVVPGHSVTSAGTAATSCSGGTCETLPLADGGDASVLFCTIDCTVAGQAACTIPGTTCISARAKGFNIDKSFCLYACGTDDAGADLGACPTSYFCFADAGVCL